MIAMFMLVGIGYRFRSWFQTKIFKALKICHISYVIFEKPFRDIEYDLMTESTKIPLVKTASPEEIFMTEDVHEDTKGHKDHSEAKTENTPSQEDPDWSYTGSVWPMPKHQIFKALADILPIAAPKNRVDVNWYHGPNKHIVVEILHEQAQRQTLRIVLYFQFLKSN